MIYRQEKKMQNDTKRSSSSLKNNDTAPQKKMTDSPKKTFKSTNKKLEFKTHKKDSSLSNENEKSISKCEIQDVKRDNSPLEKIRSSKKRKE